MAIIDSHAHLDDKKFARDLPRVIERAEEAGVEHIITFGDCVTTSRKAIALSRKHKELSAAVGVHPHHAKELNSKTLRQISELADDQHVVAIGAAAVGRRQGPAGVDPLP